MYTCDLFNQSTNNAWYAHGLLDPLVIAPYPSLADVSGL